MDPQEVDINNETHNGDNETYNPKKTIRTAVTVISIIFFLAFAGLLILNYYVVTISDNRPVVMHDNRIEINLFHFPSAPFSPFGIRYLIRGGYIVHFSEIAGIELMPYSVAQLSGHIPALQLPAYQRRHADPGFRLSVGGYFRGTRLHVHLNPESSHTIWITRHTDAPVLISHSSQQQAWVERTYRQLSQAWREYTSSEPQSTENYEEDSPFREAARLGDSYYQRYMGLDYLFGTYYLTQNTPRAVYWLKQAAMQDHVEAQSDLGWVFLMLDEVQDYNQAMYWSKRAAENGDLGAKVTIGHMYSLGRGVQIDHETALYWFRLAAQENFRYAEFNMGTMYESGFGVEIDLKQALYWYGRSAAQYHPEGMIAYARLLAYLQ